MYVVTLKSNRPGGPTELVALDPPFGVGPGLPFRKLEFVDGGIRLNYGRSSTSIFVPYHRVWEIEFKED